MPAAHSGKSPKTGVFRTPPWVARILVEETVGARLRELRAHFGLQTAASSASAERLFAFRNAVCEIKVLDPACGDGVLLLHALERIVSEQRWIAHTLHRILESSTPFDKQAAAATAIAQNLHGVDVDNNAVRQTRETLRRCCPHIDVYSLRLEANVRCGDSLLGSATGTNEPFARENSVDWHASFPEVFDRSGVASGFDCVIANPPYLKLQDLRRLDADAARLLVEARRSNGTPLYESTQTRSFDLHLPFIERGLEVLCSTGRMGLIAPSAWLASEYGRGLRRKLHRTRRLERWIDFGGVQVFERATTYTALQFFRGSPCDQIACLAAPKAEREARQRSRRIATVAYASLSQDGPWLLLPAESRRLIARLAAECESLGKRSAIVVGVQTSADSVYHLRRDGDGVRAGSLEDTAIEEAIVRPLVSGKDAKRYVEPTTGTVLLFPYDDSGDRARLLTPNELADRYPRAWEYLRSQEKVLRGREGGAFDDPSWYRFGRSQNLDKQKLPKLIVPRMTVRLSAVADIAGRFCLDNVDVNGVIAADPLELWFLAGVLNGPVANFVWRATAKRFQSGFRAANKQFIRGLPVPRATAEQRAWVAQAAAQLQAMHTQRRDRQGQGENVSALDDEIAQADAAMNARLAKLYELSASEAGLIDREERERNAEVTSRTSRRGR